MMRAIWNGTVIAETPRTKRVEGNDYFPPKSLKHGLVLPPPFPLARRIKNYVSFWNGVTIEGTREAKPSRVRRS